MTPSRNRRPLTALFLGLAIAAAGPALAQDGMRGTWACSTPMGIVPEVFLGMNGRDYTLIQRDGRGGVGTIQYAEGSDLGFTIVDGPLFSEYAVVGGTTAGDQVMLDAGSGGVALICSPRTLGRDV